MHAVQARLGVLHAMSYQAVHEVVVRTRRVVRFHFTPHMFRHTYATVLGPKRNQPTSASSSRSQ